MSRTLQLIQKEAEIQKSGGYFMKVEEASACEKRNSRSTMSEDKESLKITLVLESLTPG